jgi:hypothetical protein
MWRERAGELVLRKVRKNVPAQLVVSTRIKCRVIDGNTLAALNCELHRVL